MHEVVLPCLTFRSSSLAAKRFIRRYTCCISISSGAVVRSIPKSVLLRSADWVYPLLRKQETQQHTWLAISLPPPHTTNESLQVPLRRKGDGLSWYYCERPTERSEGVRFLVWTESFLLSVRAFYRGPTYWSQQQQGSLYVSVWVTKRRIFDGVRDLRLGTFRTAIMIEAGSLQR